MKKFCVVLVLVALCLTGVFAASSSQNSSRPVVSTELSTLSTPVYRVELYDTKTITQQEIDEAVSYYSAQLGYKVTEDEVLDDLVSTTLVNQALEKGLEDGTIDVYSGEFNSFVSTYLQQLAAGYGVELKNETDAAAFLKQFDLTYNDFAAELLTQWATEKYLEKYNGGKLSDIKETTNEEIQEYFTKNRTVFVSDEYVMPAHIFFSTGEGKNKNTQRTTANSVYNRIKNGSTTFEKAAKDYSEDEISSKVGGNLEYWVDKNDEDMISAFGADALKAMFALKVGEVSPVVEGPQGYHIFKCISKTDAKLLELNDKVNPNADATVKDYISQLIMAYKYEEKKLSAYAGLIEELKSKAKLTDLRK